MDVGNMKIRGEYQQYDPYSESVKPEHDFRALLTREDIYEANLWETFALLVEKMRTGKDSTIAYAIEGLVRIGKEEEAQLLAVEALALLAPSVHDYIRLALQKEWFRTQALAYHGTPVSAERRRLQLLYWTNRERKQPTWPPRSESQKH